MNSTQQKNYLNRAKRVRYRILFINNLVFYILLSILLGCNQVNDKENINKISNISPDRSIESVIQLIIDSESLQRFYHDSVPGREILYITGKDILDSMNLNRYGKPVQFVNSANHYENCIIVDAIRLLDSTIFVYFHYPIQGVIGEFSFIRKDNIWEIDKSKLYRY